MVVQHVYFIRGCELHVIPMYLCDVTGIVGNLFWVCLWCFKQSQVVCTTRQFYFCDYLVSCTSNLEKLDVLILLFLSLPIFLNLGKHKITLLFINEMYTSAVSSDLCHSDYFQELVSRPYAILENQAYLQLTVNLCSSCDT